MLKNPHIFSVVVEHEVARKAKIIAAKMDTSRNAIMRDLLTQFVNKHEKTAVEGGNHDTRR